MERSVSGLVIAVVIMRNTKITVPIGRCRFITKAKVPKCQLITWCVSFKSDFAGMVQTIGGLVFICKLCIAAAVLACDTECANHSPYLLLAESIVRTFDDYRSVFKIHVFKTC